MNKATKAAVTEICSQYGNDRGNMMDILRAVQERLGGIYGETIDIIAESVSAPRVEVESTASFYSFLSGKPTGEVVIRLCNDVIDKMYRVDRVAAAFSEELGIGFGETTADGKITLEWTPCIGMCDQAPAALVNDEVMTRLSTDHARDIVASLKSGREYYKLPHELGDGNNAHKLVHSMVVNHIRRPGAVIFADFQPGAGLANALGMTPVEVIRCMKIARLRGRGGAGFPTGLKWEFTHTADGERKFVICNADEGEPGTFKDRVILTERADLLFEGMTIAGYAVGSDAGVLYLRGEYTYLRRHLERILGERREAGLLGENVRGKKGFDFDIRIQMGAGAYICGEETALISSCEGLRGDPKNRPPFPAQKGFLGEPTVVNNVETLCCAARIMEKGAAWFSQFGTKGSAGTKLLSVCGDCDRPGVYEVNFGTKLSEVLEMAEAADPAAVQVSGPSGEMVAPGDFDRAISFDDLATGGSIMVFNSKRDLLGIVAEFMDFFIDESCGYCTPCRVGNVLLKERLDKIRSGQGCPEDLDYLQALGETVKTASRCGLGQTSPNPILTTLANFRQLYEALVKPATGELLATFDLESALSEAKAIAQHD